MKEWLRIFAVVVSLGAASRAFAAPGPLELWSPTPATSWNQEAYPIGNGKLAAMIFGGVANEQIQFNEETVWCGQPHDYSNPNATPRIWRASAPVSLPATTPPSGMKRANT